MELDKMDQLAEAVLRATSAPNPCVLARYFLRWMDKYTVAHRCPTATGPLLMGIVSYKLMELSDLQDVGSLCNGDVRADNRLVDRQLYGSPLPRAKNGSNDLTMHDCTPILVRGKQFIHTALAVTIAPAASTVCMP
ncbi:hypothetical protein Vretimale_1760 [Volvox reticuliferus]|uniref:Uncharacterized protein n=1 Tax=Volvox reticuliferus TaxID=1737510 RepID=A0A8J4FWN0_9CHLO|nr:hypothetical protein Vretifemale_15385 [Volvox reticuliferus]GIL95820.1 hypothetical protein Vretimale_1760 [Volvox reticuliferus]